MVLRFRGREEIPGYAEALPRLQESLVETIVDFAWCHALTLGPQCDGRAVRVRAGHHEDVVAHHAMKAGKDVRRQIRPSDVAEVQIPVCVRPGDRYENVVRHVNSLTILAVERRTRAGQPQMSSAVSDRTRATVRTLSIGMVRSVLDVGP